MKAAVGLIAGNGRLPLLLARSVRAAGHPVAAIAHIGETRRDLSRYADSLHWVQIGELGRIIDLLHKENARRVLLAGGVPKVHFFSQLRPDARAVQVLGRLADKKDDAILRAVAAELEREGIRVISPLSFLGDCAAPRGCLTARQPSERERKDILFGSDIAKKIGMLDVGQTVVVKDRIVLAMEAIEGTDAAIRRGGKLGRGDVVVVKICKPRQDLRLDLPVIGPATIRTLQKAGASVLAVEAGKTIVVDKERVVRDADRSRICLVGI